MNRNKWGLVILSVGAMVGLGWHDWANREETQFYADLKQEQIDTEIASQYAADRWGKCL